MGILGLTGLGISAIVSAACKIAGAVGVVGMSIENIKDISDKVVGVCKVFGLINSKINPDELGDRGIQAEEAGLRPENFDSYSDWVAEIEAFELNSERSLSVSESDRNLKAVEISAGLLMEKYPGIDLTPVVVNAAKLSTARASAILDVLKNEGIEKYNNIVGVITNKEKDLDKFSDGVTSLANIEKKLDPSLSDREALKKAMQSVGKIQGA